MQQSQQHIHERPRTARRYLPGTLLAATGTWIVLAACSSSSTEPIESAIASVVVTPIIENIAPSQTLQLTARVIDNAGNQVDNVPVIWASADEAVATVNGDGLVTGVDLGNTTISASADTATGMALIVVQPPAPAGVTEITGGVGYTCATRSDTQTYCWGANDRGQLGDGSTTSSPTPVLVSGGRRFIDVTAGGAGGAAAIGFTTCGIEFAPDGNAYCWGSNDSGQVGDNTPGGEKLSPTRVATGAAYLSITAGSQHTCSVQLTGQAWCWGDGTNGKLGVGSTTSWSAPRPVQSGLLMRKVSAGAEHTCALVIDGSSWCWGFGETGEFGNGNKTSDQVPVATNPSLLFSEISAGDAHTCAIGRGDGRAWCWGWNDDGQVGNGAGPNDQCGALECIPAAMQISSTESFIDISAGHRFSCGVTSSGEAYCWGNNSNGQLGQDPATVTSTSVPTKLSTSLSFIGIGVGYDHACAVTSDAEAYCWGANGTGQLGNGSTTDSFTPVPVAPPLQ